MLEVGSVVAGKLRIEAILGKGGMGTVAVATHLQLDQRVVVKVLNDELAANDEIVERFLREARASGRLRSEHVCRVSDVGRFDSGAPYIVMELLEGEDLAHVIAAKPLGIATTVDYVLQACVAIGEAHALGIVHRDLKPSNLFVTSKFDGGVLIKVLDFGIATAPSQSDFKLTRTDVVMGSPGYMSPEHLRSARDVDQRSDIWAIGVILYECVSGRLPFPGASITELAVKIVIDPPVPLDPALDPRFAAIVMRCLEKQPADRYQSVAELAADLAPLGDAAAQKTATLIARVTAKPTTAARAVGSAPIATSGTTLQTASGQATAPPKRRRGLVLGLGGVVVAAGAIAGVLAVRTADPPRKPAVAVVVPHVDASVVVASDAPASDAPDDKAAIAAKLEVLAEAHDWTAILEVAELDPGDPVVTDAKKNYVAQQAQVIDAYVQRGNCAAARATAASSAKLVPDDTTLAAKAKTCAQRPAGPVSPLEAAQDAIDRQDYAKALQLAEAVLAKDPNDSEANREAALAACGLKDADKARGYLAKLRGSDRNLVVFVCANAKVKLTAPPPSRSPVPPADAADFAKELSAAGQAMQARNYVAVQATADRMLKRWPKVPAALQLGGYAACFLKQPGRAKMLVIELPPNSPAIASIRAVCKSQSVPID